MADRQQLYGVNSPMQKGQELYGGNSPMQKGQEPSGTEITIREPKSLWGYPDYAAESNKRVFKSVHQYITDSQRFVS